MSYRIAQKKEESQSLNLWSGSRNSLEHQDGLQLNQFHYAQLELDQALLALSF